MKDSIKLNEHKIDLLFLLASLGLDVLYSTTPELVKKILLDVPESKRMMDNLIVLLEHYDTAIN